MDLHPSIAHNVGMHACIFVDKVKKEVLETKIDKSFWWVKCIDNIFFIWTHGQEKLKVLSEGLNKVHPNLKFTSGSSEKNVAFLDLNIKLKQGQIELDFQSGCCCYYCSDYIVVTNIKSLLCHFLWIFDFIRSKFTLNFSNYLFGSIALFYFILDRIK